MTAWMPLACVGVGWLLGRGSDWWSKLGERRKKRADVRRLLAHHAATLSDDALAFLREAQTVEGDSEQSIAAVFVDATTSEHVYRDQIANRLADLSDELIDLFKELDLAANDAAHSISTVQRWSSAFYAPAVMLPGPIPGSATPVRPSPNLPQSVTAALVAAIASHARLGTAARATLERLQHEHSGLPKRAIELLAVPLAPPARALPAPVRALPESGPVDVVPTARALAGSTNPAGK